MISAKQQQEKQAAEKARRNTATLREDAEHPLSREERIIGAIQPMTKLGNKLARANGVVGSDDLRQIGLVAVCEEVGGFRPEQATLLSYVNPAAYGAMVDACSEQWRKRLEKVGSGFDPTRKRRGEARPELTARPTRPRTESFDSTSMDVIEPKAPIAPDRRAIAAELVHKVLLPIIDRFDPLGKAIVQSLIEAGTTNREIAEQFGVSVDTVKRRKEKVTNLLRDAVLAAGGR